MRESSMKSQIITKPQLCFIGYADMMHQSEGHDPLPIQISKVIERFYTEQPLESFGPKPLSEALYCGYTEYTGNYSNDYTFFIGKLYSEDLEVTGDLRRIIAPRQKYMVFTNGPGPMPDICIESWQQIWRMEDSQQLGGEREYKCDFELYDERAKDPSNAELDIYVGIK